MRIATLITALTFGLFLFSAVGTSHADETVYGWQLMTEQERVEHRNKMRSFKTEQEREAYRLEHHKRMQERARERGVTLPDRPRPMGKGMGAGAGKGGGGGQNR